MKNGSVTIFFSMIVTLLLSLFFSMSETIRVVEMKNRSRVITQGALQSAFSEYQRYLWEEYGILALDGDYGAEGEGVSLVQEKISKYCWDNVSPDEESKKNGINFFRLSLESCDITEYGLLTDNNGAWLRHQGAMTAKKQISEEAIMNWGKTNQELEGNVVETGEIEKKVNSAQTAMKTAKEEKELSRETDNDASENNTENVEIPETVECDNPLEVFRQIKESGWLGLVTDTAVSEKAISLENKVSTREKTQGNLSTEVDKEGMTEALFYQWYLMNTFGRYGEVKADRVLDYEMEYILAGKESDRENLEAVIARIIAFREGENLMTILSTPSMLQQAKNVAVSVAGISGNPILLQVVQGAVVAVWALVESILDVRALLQGKKIPIIKNANNWTSELYTLATYLGSSYSAREDEKGVSYDQYLNLFLTILSEEKSGYRPMDLMEMQLHQQENYGGAKMDHMICSVQVQTVFGGEPIFLTWVPDGFENMDWYRYLSQKEIHY